MIPCQDQQGIYQLYTNYHRPSSDIVIEDPPKQKEPPRNLRALVSYIEILWDGDDGLRSLTCIKLVVIFLPKHIVQQRLATAVNRP